jgi:hypothetical protein
VELLQGDAFFDQFHAIARRAFHLEVQDSYRTPDEAGPFAAFLAGEPDDLAWHRSWLDLVRAVISSGCEIHRVRLVTVPHVDYTRWGLTIAPHNIAAGEDIRWLPRHHDDAKDLPPDDFWMLDDDRVMFTVFEPGGRFAGGALTRDEWIVTYCRSVRDRLWAAAVPHDEYVSGRQPV